MKKKLMFPFFTLLLLLIIAATFLAILISNSHREETQSTDNTGQQVTTIPTPPATPTIAPTPAITPEAVSELYPVPQTVDDETRYGYIDGTGKLVIDPSFSMASNFNDGVAVVMINDKYCVIDKIGNILFTNDYSINDFCNGYAVFYKYNESDFTSSYGFIDSKGKVIIEPRYTLATNFNKDGKAYVSKGGGEYALIDTTGKELETYTLTDEKFTSAWTLQDGYIIYAAGDYANYGVVNVKGEEILPSGFSEITYLGNDLFAVKKPGLEYGDVISVAKQAIFNSAGEQLTDYTLYDLMGFTNGYCSASDDTSTFFVGTDGKVATNLPKFEGKGTLTLLGDVVSAVVNGDLTYCNKDGSVIWKTPDSYALSDTITAKSLIYHPLRDVLVHYPVIEGLSDSKVQDQINSQLHDIFVNSRADDTSEGSMVIEDNFTAKLMKNLIIIEKTGYDYYYGAAHGMPIMSFYYIDTITGNSYQLKDLFLEGSDYTTKINKLIKDQIVADYQTGESMYFPDSFTGISETQYFKLDNDSLTIYFYPYDIAAYAAGFPEFVIPFDDVAEYLNKEGAFWKCFQE